MAESPAAEALSIPLPRPADTQTLGRRLAGLVRAGDLIALTGDLGAGKTALARALITALPAADGGDAAGEEVPSPTFTLVQTYDRRSAEGAPLAVWHFDLYRLGEADEIDELGWEEALAGGLVLVEWPDRLGARLPTPRLDVTLAYAQDDGADAADGGRGEPGRVAVLQGGAGWADRIDVLAGNAGADAASAVAASADATGADPAGADPAGTASKRAGSRGPGADG